MASDEHDVTNPFLPNPEGLNVTRDLLRGGSCFWATFTPKRVRCTVALHRSRFQPELLVEKGPESSMDGFIPCEVRARKERSKSRKDKHVVIDEDAADGQNFPNNTLKDYLNSQAGGSGGEKVISTICSILIFLRPKADPARCWSSPRRRGWSMG
ncbi:hypothetical protein Bca101_059212 [Brassica carinata]